MGKALPRTQDCWLVRDLDEEIGAAVDHLRLISEIGGGVDHAEDFDDAGDSVECAELCSEDGEQGEPGFASVLVGLLDADLSTDSAGGAARALAGEEEEVA